jgi:hypothetical protein
MAWRNYSLFR